MRPILIDVSRLIGRFMKGRLPTGVDRVSLEYIRHYRGKARAMVREKRLSFVFNKQVSDQVFDLLLQPGIGFRRDAWRLIAKGVVTGWFQKNKTATFLFNTGHSGLERKDYPEILQRLRAKPIFLIHDLIPITHPEYCRPGELDKHVTRMKNALQLGHGIIANSQATLDELSRYARMEGICMPPAVASLLAPGIPDAQPGPRPMEKPYFVMLSTIEPRKNHWLMLQIWRRLVETQGDSAPHLVVIGQRGWECENVVDLLERCRPLRGFVTELSNCSDAELITYLQHAQALLFPSFAEGYGMPLAEAMVLGVPVIASDLGVFREIAGEIPEYIDPLAGKLWIDCITDYASFDSPRRAAQLQRMWEFDCPTWEAHFAKVDAWLEQLSV